MKARIAFLFLLRCALFLGVQACASRASAQKPEYKDYAVVFTTEVSPAQSKYVFEGLRSQDPDVVISIEVAAHRALARTHVGLDRTELQAAIAPSGLVIVQMGLASEELGQTKSNTDTAADPYPTYLNTGHPVEDDARFDLAKKAWIAAHPAAYHQLTTAQPE